MLTSMNLTVQNQLYILPIKTAKTLTKKFSFFYKKTANIKGATACHYSCTYESDGKLYIIATINYEWSRRDAGLFIIDLKKI